MEYTVAIGIERGWLRVCHKSLSVEHLSRAECVAMMCANVNNRSHTYISFPCLLIIYPLYSQGSRLKMTIINIVQVSACV